MLTTVAKADHWWSADNLRFINNGGGSFSIEVDIAVCFRCTDNTYYEYYVVEQGCSPSDGFVAEGEGCKNGSGNNIELASGIFLCPGKTYDILLFTRRMNNGGAGCNNAEDRDGSARATGDLIQYRPADCGSYPWNGVPKNYDDRTITNCGSGGCRQEDPNCPYDGNWAYLLISYNTPGDPLWSFSTNIELDDCLGDFDQSYSGSSTTDGNTANVNFAPAAEIRCGSPIKITYSSDNSCGVDFPGNTYMVTDNSNISGFSPASSFFTDDVVVDDNGNGRFEVITGVEATGFVCSEGTRGISFEFQNAECTAEDGVVSVDINYPIDIFYPTSNFAAPTKVFCGNTCSTQNLVLSGTDQWVNTGLNTGASTTNETSDAVAQGFSFDWSGQICAASVALTDCTSGTATVNPDACASCGIYDITYAVANSNCSECQTSTTKQIQIVSPRITNLEANIINACTDFSPAITFDVVECNPSDGSPTTIAYTGPGSRFIERDDNPGVLMPAATANFLVTKGNTVCFTAHFQAPGCADCSTESVGTVCVTVDDTEVPTATCQNITVQLDDAGIATITAAQINNGSTDNCGVDTFYLNNYNFSCANIGPNTVTLTVADACGNTSTCTATVTVEDTAAPTFTCPSDLSIDLNNNCEIIIPDLLTGITDETDNCPTVNLTQNPIAGTAINSNDGMAHTVTITATDASGNSSMCIVTLTGNDVIPPTFSCPMDQAVDLNANCAIVVPDLLSGISDEGDECGIANLSQNPTAGTIISSADEMEHTVTITLDDGHGNSTTCTVTLTGQDVTNPSFTCPMDQNVDLDANCELIIPDLISGIVDEADNCGTTNISQNPITGTIQSSADGMTHTVTITVEDGNGNSTMCMVTLTGQDAIPPTVTCPADQIIQVDGSCNATIPDFTGLALTMDECVALPISLAQEPIAGTIISNDLDTMITVTITATDPSGNAITCNFSVSLADTLPPSFVCPSDETLALNDNCELGISDYTASVTFSDNCSSMSSILVNQSPAAGTIIAEEGTVQEIRLIAKDESGNIDSCKFSITLEDVTPPSIDCPMDETVSIDGDCPVALSDYTASAMLTDNCTDATNITVSQSPSIDSMILGDGTIVTVVLTATDDAGNSSLCSFTVTLEDIEAPMITCPMDQSLHVNESCVGIIPDYTGMASATSTCTMGTTNITQSPLAGTTFYGYTNDTLIILTVDDDNGNSTTCSFTVTLIDTLSPEIICPATIPLTLDNACQAIVGDYKNLLTISDNCTPAISLIVTQTPASGAIIDESTKEIVFSIEDEAGNSTQCVSPLVFSDTTSPSFTCPIDQDIFANENCQEVLPDYTTGIVFMDNCTPSNFLTITQSPAAGMILNGLNASQLVTINATDASGNNTSCSFTITLRDTIKPMIICPIDETLIVDNSCSIILMDYASLASPTDNCSGTGAISVVQSPIVGTILTGHGTQQIVTLTATDEAGNTSNCSFTISLKDEGNPTIVCPSNQAVQVDNSCTGTIPDYTGLLVVGDACATSDVILVTQDPVDGTMITNLDSMVTITLTAMDTLGNESSCSFLVTFQDTISPQISCPADITLALDQYCQTALADYTGSVILMDNCSNLGAITLNQTPPPGTMLEEDGTIQEVRIIATDESGNIDSCKFSISLEDITNPTIVCPENDTLSIDGLCPIPLPDYTLLAMTLDNCSNAADISITQSPPKDTMLIGATTTVTVTLTATDKAGNSQQCSFDVRLEDMDEPSIDCPADQMVQVDENCRAIIPDYTLMAVVSSNCAMSGLTVTQEPAPGITMSGYNNDTLITLTVDDGNGNRNECSFVLTLLDTILPTLSCPANFTLILDENCESVIGDYEGDLMFGDNCTPIGNLTFTQIPAAGTTLDESTTEVTFTLIDEAGNMNQCVSSLIYNDTLAPTFTCPASHDLYSDASCEMVLPNYVQEISFADNCTMMGQLIITQSPAAGATISGINTTETITILAEDEAGNRYSCNFEVTLRDTIPPTINCPANKVLVADANCQNTLSDYTTMAITEDNCSISPSGITVVQSPAIGSIIDGIDTILVVTLTATDESGNSSQCTFTVQLADQSDPTFTCPSDTTIYLGATCSEMIPDYRTLITPMDNCTELADFTITQIPAPNSVVMTAGMTQNIMMEVVDGSGNANVCTFEVMVLDTLKPTFDCPADETIALDGDCQTVIGDYTSSLNEMDNCTMAGNFTIVQSPISGTIIRNDGTIQMVKITVRDEQGNIDSCTFLLTIEDQTNPGIICPSNDTLSIDGTCPVPLPDYTGLTLKTDNCTDNGNISVTQSPPIDTMLTGDGTMVTVVLTATDEAGNTNQCSFEVSLEDTSVPNISCPSTQNIIIQADGSCIGIIPDYTNLAAVSGTCNMGTLTLSQSPLPGVSFSGHNNDTLITLTVDDGNGNTNQCSFTVTLLDTISPTISCPSSLTLYQNSNCEYVLDDYESLILVGDNCTVAANMTFTQNPMAGTTIAESLTSLIFSIEDEAGNITQCVTPLIHVDTIKPIFSCPMDRDIFLDANCDLQVPNLLMDIIDEADNCGMVNLSQSPLANTFIATSDDAIHTVTITAVDRNGNIQTCTINLTAQDTIKPTFTCPSALDLELDANCAITVPNLISGIADEADNCGTANLSQNPTAGTLLPSTDEMDHTVIITADDDNGNTLTCEVVLTAMDTIKPTFTCPIDVDINLTTDCKLVIPDLLTGIMDGADNCGTIIFTQDPIANTAINSDDGGTYTVTITASDGNGNVETCMVMITAHDVSPPTVTCPMDLVVDVDANCNIIIPDLITGITDEADNCGIVSLIQDPIATTSIPSADGNMHIVTITADDGNGNMISCMVTLTARDAINPTAICKDITLYLASNGLISISEDSIDNGSFDNCGMVTFDTDVTDFNCMDIGSKMLTLIVTDGSGNKELCTAQATIIDTIKPIAICQDIVLELDINGVGSINTSQIDNGSNDACGIDTMYLDKYDFTCADVADNTITLTVIDNNGNLSSCTAVVKVEDNTPPVANCRDTILVLDAAGLANLKAEDVYIESNDPCGIADMVLDKTDFTCNDTGLIMVTLTLIDANGNMSSCMSEVIVLDTLPPTLICKDTTIYLDATGRKNLTAADLDGGTYDACGIATLTLSQTTFTCFDVGIQHLTITATDIHGNTANCIAKVIVRDTLKPNAVCTDVTIQLDADGGAILYPHHIDHGHTHHDHGHGSEDECGIVRYQLSKTMFDCADLGENMVTLTVFDPSDNSDTCTTTVTLEDNIPPTAICKDINLYLNANGQITMKPKDIDDRSFDNCELVDLSIDRDHFTCEDLGENTVILTVTDQSGNTDTCSAMVMVYDNIPPVVNTKDITIYVDSFGIACINIDTIDNGSYDICGIESLCIERVPGSGSSHIDTTAAEGTFKFNCEDLGDTQVKLIAKDSSGNMGMSVSTVTVIDTFHPCIIVDPLDQFIEEFETVTFLGAGKGTLLSYQWQVGDSLGFVDIPGANSDTLTLIEATRIYDKSGFRLLVFDHCGRGDTSEVAILCMNKSTPVITDPCNCLGNESSIGAGDGQFSEYVVVTARTGDQWWVINNTGFYQIPSGFSFPPPTAGNPYSQKLHPIGTRLSEQPINKFHSQYLLYGLHVDGIGYQVTITDGVDTLVVGNVCQYGPSCIYNIEVSEDGSPVEILDTIPQNFILGCNDIQRIDSLKTCELTKNTFVDDGQNDGLYKDTIPRDDIFTICPENQWQTVRAIFKNFDVATGDTLCIYDGMAYKKQIPIAKWSGVGVSTTGGWIDASCDPGINQSGCLTFRFKTDGNNVKGIGWEANISCKDRGIELTPPNDLVAQLDCQETYKIFTILPATVTSTCGIVADTQLVTIYNAKGEVCKNVHLASNDMLIDTFGLGTYLIKYRLKSDTAKYTQTTISIQAKSLVCNDEITVPLGSGCAVLLTPDMLLENPCDTITDTIYYQITLKGSDKNGKEITVTGGGKGKDYTMAVGEMLDSCGGQITATIEKQYYNNLDLPFCNNGPTSQSCSTIVNIIDNAAPSFAGSIESDTFQLCSIDLSEAGLNLTPPIVIDNCANATVKFAGARYVGNASDCETKRALITWVAADNCGNSTSTEQLIVFQRPAINNFLKAPSTILSCDEYVLSDLDNLSKTGVPGIQIGQIKNGKLIPSDTIDLDTSNYVCGYILQKKESILTSDCGIKLFRYWEVLDWCIPENGSFPIDTQLVELKDTTAPTFVDNELTTRILKLPHNACTLDITDLEKPMAADNCSDVSVRMGGVFRIENKKRWSVPISDWKQLNCDSFEVHWIAEDGCQNQYAGNQYKNDTIKQLVLVEDQTKPSVVCTEKINLSLSEDRAKLHYSAIDQGSYDACGIEKFEVSRDQRTWDENVYFMCEDVHKEITVYLRVTDIKGNQNVCWMVVQVEDKSAPFCFDLADKKEVCTAFHISDLGESTDSNKDGQFDATEWVTLAAAQIELYNEKYGEPNCKDNLSCQTLDIEQEYQLIAKNCGNVHIKRRYRSTDWQGTGNVSNWAEQNIYLTYEPDWTVSLPADWTGNCGDSIPGPGLMLKNGSCDMLAYEIEEKRFTSVADACEKIIRTYTIINWCNPTIDSEEIRIERVENESGFAQAQILHSGENMDEISKFQYSQILKLTDTEAPIIEEFEVERCIYNADCQEVREFSINATDCQFIEYPNLNYSWSISIGEEQVLTGEGASFTYPVSIGITYSVKWKVNDNCGNTSLKETDYRFKDCTKPTVYCLEGLTVNLMAEQAEAQLWASDLDRGSVDNCTHKEDLQLIVWHESIGAAPTTIFEVLPLPKVINLNCHYLGVQEVRLYVIDEALNWDYCSMIVNVQDNNNSCSNNPPTDETMAMVSGLVTDWQAQTVEQVMVRAGEGTAYQTNADGHYQLMLEKSKDYQLKPSRNDNPLNGVSTFDLVIISQHILGQKSFENPYQHIAADANKSGVVTAFDMVQIRRLILNIEEQFPQNTSWRFVDAAYEFTSNNPLAENYLEIGEVTDLQQDMHLNFVGIKIGDVNGNARPSSLFLAEDRSSEETFRINLEDQYLKAGQAYSCTFRTKQIADIQGYQFTLAYKNLIVEKLNSQLAGLDNFGLQKLDKGYITTSWNTSKPKSTINNQTQNSELFQITFIALQNGLLSEQLSIINRPTPIEAYSNSENGAIMDIQLVFNTPKEKAKPFELYQNQPNPFSNSTSIKFYLPEKTEIILILQDETGRLLKTIKQDQEGGTHQIELNNLDLPSGFIYYQLITKYGSKSKKMLRLD